ncbi:sigma-70 family RNA polymerase sigma factor [Priestia megaterium]|uniref:RNA polymerase sigma factor n=1 Tax=Priestia megaterium TaxID=1404 RepID=UPI002FFE353E
MKDFEATAILEEYDYVIERTVKRILRDPSLIEDTIQEIRIKIYNALMIGNSPKELGPWISAISRNATYDELRKLQRSNNKQIKLLQLYQIKHGDKNICNLNPETKVLSKEVTQQVKAALSSLNPETKRIISLRYNGFSYRKIAKECNCSVSQVKTTLFRGRKKLLELLREQGGFIK